MENLYEYILSQINIFQDNFQKKLDEFPQFPRETVLQICNSFYYTDLPNHVEIILKQEDGVERFETYVKYIKDFIEVSLVEGIKVEEIYERLNSRINILPSEYAIIFEWLEREQFVENIVESNGLPIIDLEDIPEKEKLVEYIPRINQQDAFDRLAKNGLETGIHCQATGCGKTNIILHYIDYCIKRFGNRCKIILFTERVNILSDLFDLTKKRITANKENIKYWKKLGIADLTNLKIVNRVTIKKKDWDTELNKAIKPTLLVINRAFLTLGQKYKKLENISLVLHDECHNTTSKQCHNLLLSLKSKKVPIVGFSATPLRTGKHDLSKLREVYLDGEQDDESDFPLLTNYSMVYAISSKLILPPQFYWYQIDETRINRKDKNKIYDAEIATVMDLLNSIIPKMPNKKIVAWCGRIDNARKWKEVFEKEHRKRTYMYSFKFYLDTSQNTNEEYHQFRKSNGNSILFCANKHREGSDIRKLDSCIFLDRVKNRGCIPFIQSIGRVLRLDKGNHAKTNGFVIDGIYKNEDYDKTFVDKILGYYMNLENSLCKLENLREEKNRYETYVRLKEMIQFSENREEISIKFGESEIKIHLNRLGWDDVIQKFDSVLQKKIKLSAESNMIHKGRMLVRYFNFTERTDFIRAYQEIPEEKKLEFNFPDLDKEETQTVFMGKTWFDFLGLKPEFYCTIQEAKTSLERQGIVLENASSNWLEWCKLDTKLPPYPQYWWRDTFYYRYFEKPKNLNLFA